MSNGCDCIELCSMGPTCPGGILAGLPGSGCWRTRRTCPTCGGAGIVDTSPPGVEYTAPWLLTDTDCPRCDGTGEIDPTTYEPDIEES